MTTTVPANWCQSIAEELHRIAYDLGRVANVQGGLPEPTYVHLHIQPRGDKGQQIAAIADLGLAVAGKTGSPQKMSDGTYHYSVEARRGPVTFQAYTSVETAEALRMIAEDEQAQKDIELERLRTRVAELESRAAGVTPEPIAEHYETGGWKGEGAGTCGIECACGVTYDGFDSLAEAKLQLSWHIADPSGQDYGRADTADQADPTPTGPREPLHTGGMTEQGLVDETGGYWRPTGRAV